MHNMGYWNYDDFLGVSMGAAGKIGSNRYTNTRDLKRYLSEEDIRDENLYLETDEMAFENIMMSLRTIYGLDIEEFEGFQFPVDIVFNSRSGSLKGHSTFTHGNEPVYVNAEIYRNDDGDIKFRLNWDVVAGIQSNELILRDVVVYLD